ncbi:MAG: hypothetical protein WA974_13180 [Thermodesulfobacteriota bacterium]
MNIPVKILHIDPDFKVTYFIFRSGASIYSSVPLQQAIELLKTEDFDLILSEPHNKAILKSQTSSDDAGLLAFQVMKQ